MLALIMFIISMITTPTYCQDCTPPPYTDEVNEVTKMPDGTYGKPVIIIPCE